MDNLENRATSRLSEQITRDYRILSLLGKGGMGEVYLAEQLRVGRRRVALKVLSRACSEDPEIVKRFENEAASSGRIHHRNVVMIFESRASDDGQLYVAMEYVNGKTLRDEIQERGALPLAEVVEISKQICAGLSAAHRLGIVHRDIKPDNLMLMRDDDGARVVKVLDFGIARLAEPGTAQSRTASGIIMGTPYYMSPEQALGSTGDKIDARSDIYSLGMVVYQMLTGRVAFESDSWMGVMYKHLHEPPLQPRELRPELGWYEEFEQAVLRALEKDRDKRPQTVSEFAEEMETAYRRAIAANPETVSAGAYDVTVAGLAPPFMQATAAAQPARQQTVAPVAAATQAAGQATVAATAPSALSNRRKTLAIAGLLILAVMSAIYFLRSKPVATPQKVAVDTVPAAAVARPMPEIETFEFEVLTVEPSGHLNVPHRRSASYFSEDIDGEVSLDMVEIPGGAFKMGAPLETQRERKQSERPQRQIRVPGFFVSKYEITEAEWRAVARLPLVSRQLEENPSSFKGDGQMPVQNISWLDAVEFCERLSRATGRRYRLPTEAEWEYACAAGTQTPFYFGETITAELVNYDANYPYGAGPKGETRRRPISVGALSAPNAFGLYNMHGNVAEWCSDYWHDSYIGAPADASSWESRGDASVRVLRGGSYYDGGDDCRSSARTKDPADIRLPFIGFRVVMVAP
ncbi:MAG TPA: SUMF1/EgtB/PvdO family nonheme iron enzyme [Blastocatellia bacterium]|nr:SUMF1/EgtB/PvdO family nonheme iron enzyme [Blastocatellia bacterium]